MTGPRGTTHLEKRTVKPSVLRDIVRRVVEVAQPETIILFGSAVRGEMGPDSDVDLLVIKGGRFQRGRLVDKIYSNMRGAGEAVNIIVVTPEEVERYRNAPCLVIYPALREGKVVYGCNGCLRTTPREWLDRHRGRGWRRSAVRAEAAGGPTGRRRSAVMRCPTHPLGDLIAQRFPLLDMPSDR